MPEDNFHPEHINKKWTLFLDRDGVINVRLPGDYVKTPEEFVFLPGAEKAIADLGRIFGRVIVVTNQQGIGKGLYTEDDLADIHAKMRAGVEMAGGSIDGIYFAPQLSAENSAMRKPGIGMALAAKQDFPDIDLSLSVMVGDSPSDMEFAHKSGMIPVYCGSEPVTVTIACNVGGIVEFRDLILGHTKA